MNLQFSDEAMNSAIQHKNRPKYSSPKLVEYGALREITLSVGKTGITDGGGTGSSNKTRA